MKQLFLNRYADYRQQMGTRAGRKPIPNRPLLRLTVALSLLLALLGGLAQHAQAQVYGLRAPGTILYRYNIATNNWSTLAASGTTLEGNLAADGIYLYAQGANSTDLFRYTIANNTWVGFASIQQLVVLNGELVSNGSQYVYGVAKGTTKFYRYDVTAATSTTLTAPPAALQGGLTFNGAYLYAPANGSTTFYRYNIALGTWSTVAASPNVISGDLVYDGSQYIYGLPLNSTTVYRYNIASNTWSALPVAPAALKGNIASDGTSLYTQANASTTLYRYNVASGTWSTLAPAPVVIDGSLVFSNLPCSPPSFTATVTQATCAGGTANSNGTISISGVTGGSRVGFSTGSTYTGPAFGSATSFTGTSATVSSTLANPTVAQPYTIRVFCDATNFTDQVVTLQPSQCIAANLSLSVTPPSQTKNPGEVASYTATLTNSGPNTATNVRVRVQVPGNTTFLGAIPQQGTYDESTNIWTLPSLVVGSQTLTVNLRLN